MYRVALIGTGRVGCQFNFGDLPDNHAEAVVQTGRGRLVAGVNRGKEKLDVFGRHFGVTALYHDLTRMLEEIGPDICIIATHPELHCEMVVECARFASTRAIVCEKPMALSLAECDAMIDACDRAGVLLQINHNRRWSPEWLLAGKLLADGAIGTLNTLSCHIDGGKPAPSWRSENEGPLLHDFTHFFDLMDMYAGEAAWISGMAEQRRRPYAVEDFAAAFMKFKNGATGVIHCSELTHYTDAGFELRGSDGIIRMTGEQVAWSRSVPDITEPASGFAWYKLEPQPIERPVPVSTYIVALEELMDTLEDIASLRSDGRVGRRSLEMVMGIYQSQLEGGRPVPFPITMTDSGVLRLREQNRFIDLPR